MTRPTSFTHVDRRPGAAAEVAARLTGAALVLDVPAGARTAIAAPPSAPGPPGGARRRGGAVLVEEERQAHEVRSALGLPYLPPVVPSPLPNDAAAAPHRRLRAAPAPFSHVSARGSVAGRSRESRRCCRPPPSCFGPGTCAAPALAAYLRGRSASGCGPQSGGDRGPGQRPPEGPRERRYAALPGASDAREQGRRGRCRTDVGSTRASTRRRRPACVLVRRVWTLSGRASRCRGA